MEVRAAYWDIVKMLFSPKDICGTPSSQPDSEVSNVGLKDISRKLSDL